MLLKKHERKSCLPTVEPAVANAVGQDARAVWEKSRAVGRDARDVRRDGRAVGRESNPTG